MTNEATAVLGFSCILYGIEIEGILMKWKVRKTFVNIFLSNHIAFFIDPENSECPFHPNRWKKVGKNRWTEEVCKSKYI